jgi:hypothetical protein
MEITEIPVPARHVSVEHDDGAVHAIDLDDTDMPEYSGIPLWRVPPVCGTGTGVSSDEGGPYALHKPAVTCWQCIAILS